MTDSSRRSQFWSKSIVFDRFWLKYLFRDRKSQLKGQKSQIKDRKSWFKDQKIQFKLKKSIYIEKVDLYQKSQLILEINQLFDHILVWIRIVATISIDSGDNFGSKKSIKRRFESDLKWNLAWGRLNHISLLD